MKYGYLYYLDGAGGGTAKNNWAAGVREGLLAAGYRGAGEMFSWEEGRGLLVDQDASVKYKRGKADLMAKELVRQKKAFPNAPVNILGFSGAPPKPYSRSRRCRRMCRSSMWCSSAPR